MKQAERVEVWWAMEGFLNHRASESLICKVYTECQPKPGSSVVTTRVTNQTPKTSSYAFSSFGARVASHSSCIKQKACSVFSRFHSMFFEWNVSSADVDMEKQSNRLSVQLGQNWACLKEAGPWWFTVPPSWRTSVCRHCWKIHLFKVSCYSHFQTFHSPSWPG